MRRRIGSASAGVAEWETAARRAE
uniref:Uncharacterized protein n=1 Tax=Arundo donax TaxID=35708 RepID=A0A0A9BC28_ARUDO